MKTQYYTASSLDGFIATEDHSLEWLFQLGDINDTSWTPRNPSRTPKRKRESATSGLLVGVTWSVNSMTLGC